MAHKRDTDVPIILTSNKSNEIVAHTRHTANKIITVPLNKPDRVHGTKCSYLQSVVSAKQSQFQNIRLYMLNFGMVN